MGEGELPLSRRARLYRVRRDEMRRLRDMSDGLLHVSLWRDQQGPGQNPGA